MAIDGSTAARYDVFERSGEGTLFVLYRARNKETQTVHALKALKSAYSQHPQFSAAIAEAAHDVSALRHPQICKISEIGREESTLFFAEEWLPGGSLEKRLRRAPLGRVEIMTFTTRILDGLAALHENNLAHGDLRPSQLLFDARDSLKITDIGFSAAYKAAGMSLVEVQTEAAHYLAPERWDGQPPSASADLYALGVILYRATTGRVPYDGTSPMSIAMRHRGDAPLLPTQFNPHCPPELEEFILRLLEKDPAKRFLSAREALKVLAPEQALAPVRHTTPLMLPDQPGADAPEQDPEEKKVHDQAVKEAVQADHQQREVQKQEKLTAEQARLAQKRHARREMWGAFMALFGMLVAVGLLFGVLYGAYIYWIEESPPELAVPDYIGLHQRDAENLLDKAGLKMRVDKETYNPQEPEGIVLSGDPAPGKMVRVGRPVAVTISRGEEPVRMVDFTELSLNQARDIIQRHGMRLGQIAEQYHEQIPQGFICGQFPEPGDFFRRSQPINLVLSRGPLPPRTAPSPSMLPTAPIPPRPAKKRPKPSPEVKPESSPRPVEADGEPLITRGAVVSVALPEGDGPQEIKIVVQDSEGEYVAYQGTHQAGEVIDKPIQVLRPQGTLASVRVYVGGHLIQEIDV